MVLDKKIVTVVIFFLGILTFQFFEIREERNRVAYLAFNLELLESVISDHQGEISLMRSNLVGSRFRLTEVKGGRAEVFKNYILTFVISDDERDEILRRYNPSVIDRHGYMSISVGADGRIVQIDPFSKP